MPVQIPQQPASPCAARATFRPGHWLGIPLFSLCLCAGLAASPGASAQSAARAPEPTSKLDSPLTEERAAKQVVAEAADGDAPVPAPVPEPPAQSSEEDSVIELPIAPAGTGEDDPEEIVTPDAGPSDTVATSPVGTGELQALSVLFAEGGSTIDPAVESELVRLAAYLTANQTQRVVLEAYAGSEDQGRSEARRLSLSRALAIRGFLADRGVPADRVAVRPLGYGVADGPPDRVDILPLRP